MARKNKLDKNSKTKYPNIYKLEMADGTINYVAKFIHNGTRYAEKNLTKLRGKTSAKAAFDELNDIRNQLSRGVDVFNVKSNKVEDLLFKYLDTRSDEYNRVSWFYYNKYIKQVIGHLLITNVQKEHLLKIKKNSIKDGRYKQT